MKTVIFLTLICLSSTIIIGCKDTPTNVADLNTQELFSKKTFTNISVVIRNVSVEYLFTSKSENHINGSSSDNSYESFQSDDFNFGLMKKFETSFFNDSSLNMSYYYYTRTGYYSENAYSGNAKFYPNPSSAIFDSITIFEGYYNKEQSDKASEVRYESYGYYIALRNVPFEMKGDSSLSFYDSGRRIESYFTKIYHSTSESTNNAPITYSNSKRPTGNFKITDSSWLEIKLW